MSDTSGVNREVAAAYTNRILEGFQQADTPDARQQWAQTVIDAFKEDGFNPTEVRAARVAAGTLLGMADDRKAQVGELDEAIEAFSQQIDMLERNGADDGPNTQLGRLKQRLDSAERGRDFNASLLQDLTADSEAAVSMVREILAEQSAGK